MPNHETPTAEQIQALRTWALRFGRNWKVALRDAWMDGDYQGFEDSHLLQQVRNTFGPSWLVRFYLPKDSNGFTVYEPGRVPADHFLKGKVL
jgi:hypothetical protein